MLREKAKGSALRQSRRPSVPPAGLTSRRAAITGLVVVALGATSQLPAAERDPAQKFADAWNAWNSKQSQGLDHIVDVKEYFLWDETKRLWRKLEKLVDQRYRGER